MNTKLKGFKVIKKFPGAKYGDKYTPFLGSDLNFWQRNGNYDDVLKLEDIVEYSENFEPFFYTEEELESINIKSAVKLESNDVSEMTSAPEAEPQKPSIFGKRIFVVYMEVGNTDPKDVPSYMEKAKATMPFDKYEDAIAFFIPTRGQTCSRIEILQ